jgi:hypothetical protein
MVSASDRLAAFTPEGMVTGSGAGRALFFGRYGCSLHRPTQRTGLSAAIPRIASLPGASPTFSRHGGAMLRIEGRSHAAHRGAEPCCA